MASITEDAGLKLENATLDMLGTGRRITINKETTTIVAEGNEQAVNARWIKLRSKWMKPILHMTKKSFKNVYQTCGRSCRN